RQGSSCLQKEFALFSLHHQRGHAW
ncbi:hypothetical protein D031_2380B, partial [Vibrio parahaemolyticus VP-48]